MRSRYSVLLFLLVLGGFTVASGCGGGDSEASHAPNDEATIVKADFIQAANEACEERAQQMRIKLRRIYKHAKGESLNEGKKLLVDEAIVPGFEHELADLSALEPPPGDEDEVEGVIDTIQEMVDRTKEDFAEGRNYPYRKTENASAAYGLPACGHP